MRVSVIIPTKGRHEQLASLLPRLRSTSGYDDAEYIVVADEDSEGQQVAEQAAPWARTMLTYRRLGYWGACALAQEEATGTLSIALANDLLPCRAWLARGVAAYRRCFGSGFGVLGANDGAQPTIVNGPQVQVRLEWASHFLIHRGLLEQFGGWPAWYDHTHGDLEIAARARALGKFAFEPLFVLYHNHWLNGAAHDPVYALGEAEQDRDARLFQERRSAEWPAVMS